MPSVDLFPHFRTETVAIDDATVHVRIGGCGSPLLLLHGFPQTHAMWHRVAPALAEHFELVIPDLPGYGRSSIPPDTPDHFPYSKRAVGQLVHRLMGRLGHSRFAVVGHDRGARVAYRLALDMPDCITRLAVLDIVPTGVMWSSITAESALRVYHWMFFAQPAPLPEMLIGPNSDAFIDHTLASWTAKKDLSAFDPVALDEYRAFYREPARLHATCEDYRAGAGIDRRLDEESRRADARIDAPLLALWGRAGIPAGGSAPDSVWRDWARDVRGVAVESGHFVCEENPGDTARHLLAFFGDDVQESARASGPAVA